MQIQETKCEVLSVIGEIRFARNLFSAADDASVLSKEVFAELNTKFCKIDMPLIRREWEDKIEALRVKMSFATCRSLEGAIYLLAASGFHAWYAGCIYDDESSGYSGAAIAKEELRIFERMRREAIRYLCSITELEMYSDTLGEMSGLRIREDSVFLHDEKALKALQKEVHELRDVAV